MKNDRRTFLKLAGMAGLMAKGRKLFGETGLYQDYFSRYSGEISAQAVTSIIGSYGPWAAGLLDNQLPLYSFRRDNWKSLAKWAKPAKRRYLERLSMPAFGGLPQVNVTRKYTYDGLYIEEMNWALPNGGRCEAILLKPADASGRLPGVLAFHDHSGNKYFGTAKIVRTSDKEHPMMQEHKKDMYEGRAWANDLAKRGYVVLASDAFPFASRRVMLKDVPESQRQGLTDPDPGDQDGIRAYNRWAGQHEHIMAKSLFSAGTTWPAVFLAEDIKALDVLCAREDVDSEKIGCCGLSGGGMRSVFIAGADERIKCAIPVGFMTTWRDLVLDKATSHTWMTYVPLLPNELDFPEILGLRIPLPSLVLNNSEDPLFTLGEMKRADEILKKVYEKSGAAGNYKCSFHPGPHKFDAAMQEEAFEWFDRWLK
ncbi:MAG TPA: prolyl oligopeptidase family serine peptidase [Bacteroidales bacterium]|nr:prolyl oligopeptidase family serine peptidase [Bacteroidales bacterium]HPX44433.1 prolyl oligopeptidase family serine peptidase [Bacteroidales bacterium]HQB86968.1 prolyl oligopeptidase family serine peptidase [Bacteroidales bacterium]